jgi:hypothetical protein
MCHSCFEKIKEIYHISIVISIPNNKNNNTIHCDSSIYSLSSVLVKEKNDKGIINFIIDIYK